MGGHGLCVLQGAAGFKIRGDARGAEGMAAHPDTCAELASLFAGEHRGLARLDHMLGPGAYSDAFASAFIAPINPAIFRRRSIASAA
jgi:hypothetical protein